MSPISINIYKNIPILKITGMLHLAMTREFTDLLRYFIQSGRLFIIVDLSELEGMQSAGLAALAAGANQLEAQGGKLIVVAPASASIIQLIDLSHSGRYLTIFETLEEALEHIPPQGE
ncbi:MAG: hypothetical protein Kow0059_13800 [Candidatus Sumerlaeia bacterium]